MAVSQNKLGRYDLIREIAHSNDIVYEGWDARFNRRIAIKVLNLPATLSDAEKNERITRFEREARAVGSLDHPNIMHVYDCGCEGDENYMVMELIEGVSLQDELMRQGQFDVKSTTQVLSQLLDALAHSHEMGVIHRDLKPANIQYLPGGHIKLMDFGIARLTYEAAMTQAGYVLGTVYYLSPEQARGQAVDARSDLFSVGSIAYKLLTGSYPFDGTSDVAVAMAVINSEPVYPSTFNNEVVSFLKKSLAKDPGARYQSAIHMRAALNALGSQGSSSGMPSASPANQPGVAVQAANPMPRAAGPAQPRNLANPQPWLSKKRLVQGIAVATLLALLVPVLRLPIALLCFICAVCAYGISQGYRRWLAAAVSVFTFTVLVAYGLRSVSYPTVVGSPIPTVTPGSGTANGGRSSSQGGSVSVPIDPRPTHGPPEQPGSINSPGKTPRRPTPSSPAKGGNGHTHSSPRHPRDLSDDANAANRSSSETRNPRDLSDSASPEQTPSQGRDSSDTPSDRDPLRGN